MSDMSPIQTYVFLDLETGGKDETNRIKIIEISLVAVKRQHLLDTRIGSSPRVQNKLTLCVNPRKMIHPDATKTTGLSNDLLEFEAAFDKNLFNLLNTFIIVLTKPVCFIAQNGLNFDFPILRNYLEKLGVSFSEDVACADCFYAFYDIIESRKVNETEVSRLVDANDIESEYVDELELSFSSNSLKSKEENERSPTRFISFSPTTPIKHSKLHINRRNPKVRGRFPWSEGKKPKEKYKLTHIYERLLNRPAQNAHRAENDCILALECAVALSNEFVKWVDENNCLFSTVRPMTIGVPLGM